MTSRQPASTCICLYSLDDEGCQQMASPHTGSDEPHICAEKSKQGIVKKLKHKNIGRIFRDYSIARHNLMG